MVPLIIKPQALTMAALAIVAVSARGADTNTNANTINTNTNANTNSNSNSNHFLSSSNHFLSSSLRRLWSFETIFGGESPEEKLKREEKERIKAAQERERLETMKRDEERM
jgi:hypothetical protein